MHTAARIVIQKGFNDTGLQEILQAAAVPKGSFYFYFRSKEDFGLQLIDFYADFFQRHAAEIFSDEESSHVAKIRQFLDWQGDYMEAKGYQGGCPFGNLAQEMADRNDNFRIRIKAVFDRLRHDLAGVLDQAQATGEIDPGLDTIDAADHIICAWQGALMQMKLSKTSYSRNVFKQHIFGGLLAPPAEASP